MNISDSNGKRDESKFQQLAARPVSERNLDIEAYDSLYRSTAGGLSDRSITLAKFLTYRSGKANRQKLYALLQEILQDSRIAKEQEELNTYKTLLEKMNTLGESEASLQLFMDTQPGAMVAAKTKGCGIDITNQELPTITSTKITHPLNGAIYLPSQVAGYEHTYLVFGTWQEEWGYQICGKTVPVGIQFVADGLGGAAAAIVFIVDGKDIKNGQAPD